MAGIQQIKGNVRVLRLGWISSLLLHYIQIALLACSRASKSTTATVDDTPAVDAIDGV